MDVARDSRLDFSFAPHEVRVRVKQTGQQLPVKALLGSSLRVLGSSLREKRAFLGLTLRLSTATLLCKQGAGKRSEHRS